MKKLIYVLLICAALTGLSSCNSNEDDVFQQFETNSELLNELNSFNQSLNVRSETKGSALWISQGKGRLTKKQLMIIVSADVGGAIGGGKGGLEIGGIVGGCLGSPITGAAVGATVGALGGAAWASWLAAPELPDQDQEIQERGIDPFFDRNSPVYHTIVNRYDPEYIESQYCELEDLYGELVVEDDVLENVELAEEDLEIGLLHNFVLAMLSGDIEMEYDVEPQTKSSMEEEPSIDELVMDSPEMEELFSDISCGNILNDDSLPSSIFSLYTNLLEQYPEDCDDIVFMINSYHNIISSSNELTSDEKHMIDIGLAVSLYSYNYWSTKLN